MTPDQVRSEVRGEVRLVALTRVDAERFNDLRMWLDGEAERESKAGHGALAAAWRNQADRIERLFQAWQEGVTEDEACIAQTSCNLCIEAEYEPEIAATLRERLAPIVAAWSRRCHAAFKDS